MLLIPIKCAISVYFYSHSISGGGGFYAVAVVVGADCCAQLILVVIVLSADDREAVALLNPSQSISGAIQ